MILQHTQSERENTVERVSNLIARLREKQLQLARQGLILESARIAQRARKITDRSAQS